MRKETTLTFLTLGTAGILEDKAPPNKGVPTGIGSAKKVTVKGGGQFRDTWTAARDWAYQSTKGYSGTFYIEGAGPDGSGALYGNAAGGPGDRLFSLITLTGPATIGGARGCYGGGTFNMNGFTFTKANSGASSRMRFPPATSR